MHLCLQIIHDINCLAKEISGAYLDHVLQVLSSCSTEVLDLVKQSILYCGKSLDDLLPLVINTIMEALVQKSVEVSIPMLVYILFASFFKCEITTSLIIFTVNWLLAFSRTFCSFSFVLNFKGLETVEGDNCNLQDDKQTSSCQAFTLCGRGIAPIEGMQFF